MSSNLAIEKYRHPILFYTLATVIPWGFWFAAAYLSHQPEPSRAQEIAIGVLGVAGLFAPAVIAFAMIGRDRELRSDLVPRLFSLRRVGPLYLFLACFLMLGSILLAQAVSLLFGYSADQFRLTERTSFSAGIFPGWFMLFLAPPVEELAWHSYGTDSLRSRMNLLATSLVFGVYWAVWHFPLSLIEGYYHANVAAEGTLYSLNFAVSILPFVVIMNWLYYKAHRNILIAIIFHTTAGCFNEAFNTHPDSKVIQTGLLAVLAVFLVVREPRFFLAREYRE